MSSCPYCNAEVFVGDVIVRCLRCQRDLEGKIPREPINLSQKGETDTSGVSTVGFMEESLGNNLKSHFKTILLMLAEGAVPEYEIISEFEVRRFEDFLRKNRINYIKKSIFVKMKETSYLFSLPEEE
jgi:hypothetical protein